MEADAVTTCRAARSRSALPVVWSAVISTLSNGATTISKIGGDESDTLPEASQERTRRRSGPALSDILVNKILTSTSSSPKMAWNLEAATGSGTFKSVVAVPSRRTSVETTPSTSSSRSFASVFDDTA